LEGNATRVLAFSAVVADCKASRIIVEASLLTRVKGGSGGFGHYDCPQDKSKQDSPTR
jgi:hypothetical protein